MSPTFKNENGYRFSIFLNEELNKIIVIVKENEDDFKAKYKAHIG